MMLKIWLNLFVVHHKLPRLGKTLWFTTNAAEGLGKTLWFTTNAAEGLGKTLWFTTNCR